MANQFGGNLKQALIAGGAAGNLTVTGIKTTDHLVSVVVFTTAAAIATAANLTAEFSITALNTINNTGGTATTNNAVLVTYLDRTLA
jgi:hypothetical protein